MILVCMSELRLPELFFDYRLIIVYLLLQENCGKIIHARWNFDASNARNQKGEYIGQASKLTQKQ